MITPLSNKDFRTAEISIELAQQLCDLFNPVKVKFTSSENYQESINLAYKLMKGQDFQRIYFSIADYLSKKFFDYEKLFIQPKPSFRIQPLKSTTVPFHIDKWSGHPDNIVNVWIPLSEITSSSALQIIPSKISSQLILNFEKGLLSLSEFNEKCSLIAEPQIVPIGNVLFFSNKTLHGTVENKDKKIRISLDFRFTYAEEGFGSKKFGNDYIPVNQLQKKAKLIRNKVHSIVYAAGKYKHISHSMQRSFINGYANENNFEIKTENSELLGCEGLPQVIYLLNNAIEPIILFSYHNLTKKQLLILKKLDQNKKNRIIFALESINLNDLKF
tara:strand:- start:366 stop:1355 length:990 start_codon:yes stop_codon:yes gene_type:complete